MKWIKKVKTTPLEAVAKVVDSLNAQLNDRINAPSIRSVREAIGENWLTIYPVGSIYMSVNEVNPGEMFGGTWQQIKDKFLLCAGDNHTNGETGGTESASVVIGGTVGNTALSLAQMPAHTHQVEGDASSNNSYIALDATDVQVQSGSGAYVSRIGSGTRSLNVNGVARGIGDSQPHTHTFTGSTQNINKMPPYMAVNVWVRTA